MRILFPFIAYTCDDLCRRLETIFIVSSPDPTLEEGNGSGEFGHNPWTRERNLSAPMRLQLYLSHMTRQPQEFKAPLPAVYI